MNKSTYAYAAADYLIEDIDDRINELGLTHSEIEKRADLGHGYLSHILSQRRHPQLRKFQQLAGVLGLKLVLV